MVSAEDRIWKSLFRWQDGRQKTGYRKMLLAQSARLRLDAWLLDYPRWTAIPEHTDPVPGRTHVRANLVLFGEQSYEGDAIVRIGPLVIFRPDITPHRVRMSHRRRVVLSIGVAA